MACRATLQTGDQIIIQIAYVQVAGHPNRHWDQ
jgi:hypothetical protein